MICTTICLDLYWGDTNLCLDMTLFIFITHNLISWLYNNLCTLKLYIFKYIIIYIYIYITIF